MTQFEKRSHPARDRLIEAGRRLPSIWKHIETERLESEETPPQVYISELAAARAFVLAVRNDLGHDEMNELTKIEAARLALSVAPFVTLAAWRMTQGIYRIDPSLYEALLTTELAGDIPADVLMRLPEWCLYVETPGLTARDNNGHLSGLSGAWARIAMEPGTPPALVIALDIAGESFIVHHYLPLVGSLADSLKRAESAKAIYNATEDGNRIVTEAVAPIINLLLYICAESDISGKRGAPKNPVPLRTRRGGWRLFPADGLRMWDVGVRIGAALRAAYHAEQIGQGGEHAGPRPHVRRAHWHGFRSGRRKRDDGTDIPAHERRFDLKWLPPIPVNVADIDALPAVIRKV